MSSVARAGSRLRELPRTGSAGVGALARRVVLAALEHLEGGELELRLPDGTVRRFGTPDEGLRLTATIERDALFRRLARRGRTGLGESYVAGDWHADDLPALLGLLLQNAAAAAERPPISTLAKLQLLRPRLPARSSLRRSRRDIRYHYDLGNDLFRLFLDDSLTYSCAYFEHPGQTLEEAQQAKYRRLCEKLEIDERDHVLEIGCGWGGFALHAAGKRGARVTGLTISEAQHALARERVAEAGLGERVRILLRDYRLAEGRFTKIVSIEMLEAIGQRQFGTFFAVCDRLLAPGGLVGLQTIAIPDQRFERYRRQSDWIQEYVFPGSFLPSLTAITNAMTRSSRLTVHGLEDIGIHYAGTLQCWRERFFGALDEARRLGYDERFVKIWDYYLASCEALFRTRSLRDLQLVLTRSHNDRLPRYPSSRLTF